MADQFDPEKIKAALAAYDAYLAANEITQDAPLDIEDLPRTKQITVLTGFERTYKKLAGKLSFNERQALDKYGAGDYITMNSLFRNPDLAGAYGTFDEEAAENATSILDIMRRCALPQNISLYRGITWNDDQASPLPADAFQKGGEWQESAFVSTSALKRPAEEFLTSDHHLHPDKDHHQVLLHLTVPKGTPSLCLNGIIDATEADEEEFILPPGSKWQTYKIEETDDITHLYAHLVGLEMPEHAPDLVHEPVKTPYRRSSKEPIYIYGGAREGHIFDDMTEYKRTQGLEKTDHFAWVSKEVFARQMEDEFIVDGPDGAELGHVGEWVAQDKETGEAWYVPDHVIQKFYTPKPELSQRPSEFLQGQSKHHGLDLTN